MQGQKTEWIFLPFLFHPVRSHPFLQIRKDCGRTYRVFPAVPQHMPEPRVFPLFFRYFSPAPESRIRNPHEWKNRCTYRGMSYKRAHNQTDTALPLLPPFQNTGIRHKCLPHKSFCLRRQNRAKMGNLLFFLQSYRSNAHKGTLFRSAHRRHHNHRPCLPATRSSVPGRPADTDAIDQ